MPERGWDDTGDGDLGLLRPGSAAGFAASGDRAVLRAILDVEVQWVGCLEAAGLAPDGAMDAALTHADARTFDLSALALASRRGGNPVIPALDELRRRVAGTSREAAARLHTGLTSQDVLDTALVLVVRRAGEVVVADLRSAASSLVRLSQAHSRAPALARTLSQAAGPTTVGLRLATWLEAVVDAGRRLEDVLARLPVQVGGSFGTREALAQLCRGRQVGVSSLVADLAGRLGVTTTIPWQTRRSVVTRIGEALAEVVVTAGRVAGDTLLLGRPEVGEVVERAPGGSGGSSAMPHKRNPTTAVLLRSLAIAAPHDLAALVSAAGQAVDERSDGAWQAEWPALVGLVRGAVAAAGLLEELAAGLEVVEARALANLHAAGDAVLSELASRRLEGQGEAGGAVAAAVAGGEPLADALRVHVPHLTAAELAELTDPTTYLDSAESLRRAILLRVQEWVG